MADFRVLLYRQDGTPEGELSKDAGTLLSCTRSEEINGEHSLTLTTERHLEVGTRALTRHADGRWREWVVDEPAETHDSGAHAVGTYHLCWSLQYDLQTVYGRILVVGVDAGDAGSYGRVRRTTASDARSALGCAIDGTVRWAVGTVDVSTKARYVVMAEDTSAWDRLTTVVKYWGGEIDAEIGVGANGVTSRRVSLQRHLGSKVATRRFEWGFDLTGITRTPDPGPYYCRVIPLGNGESEDAGDGSTFNVGLDVSTAATFAVGDLRHDRGSIYLRDTRSESVFRVADGRGGYEYPTCVISYSTDDVDELVTLSKADALSHTRPGISYSGSVANFAKAGMDTDGICLGDEVQVLDHGFNPDAALRVQERILSVEIDEMGVDDARLNIGKLNPKIERTIATVTKTIGTKSVSYNAPVWDSSKYAVETPDLSHYSIDPISSDGYSYEIPSVSYDIPDYGTAIADLQSQIGDMSVGGSYSGVGGDDIVHKLNGVTLGSGSVIEFTTAAKNEIDHGRGSDELPDASDWGKAAAKKKVNSAKKALVSLSKMWGSGS